MASIQRAIARGNLAHKAKIGRGALLARAEAAVHRRRKVPRPAGRARPARPPAPLFTLPAKTISAASRVSASVTRSPLMNSLCLPSAFSVRVNCTPPPCTTATWWPSRTSSAMARVQPSSSDGVSRPAPPNLTTYFIPALRSALIPVLRLRPAQHHIQILHGLAGCALQQIIQATDDHRAPAAGVELKADVRIVGAHRVLNLRQMPCRKAAPSGCRQKTRDRPCATLCPRLRLR